MSKKSQYFEIHIDESNTNTSDGKFFVVGGLILSPDQEIELHEKIEKIRQEWELGDSQEIKYRMRSSNGLSSDDVKAIKSGVIDAVIDIGATAIIYAVLHDIARRDSVDQKTSKGIDQVVDVFSRRFLQDVSGFGSVCVDRRNGAGPFNDVERIFKKGRTSGSWPNRQFDRIIHTSVTTARCSHLNSALDVVLGSIQYCINLEPTERSWEVARAMYPRVNQLLYRRQDGVGRRVISGNGLIMSPQTVTVPRYKSRYEDVIRNLNALLR